MRCGLLGEKLGHSYSPQIHAELGDYEYLLYEKAPDEVENFVRCGDWHGLNVTIPYKKTVIPFCDELSETARAIGSVLAPRGLLLIGLDIIGRHVTEINVTSPTCFQEIEQQTDCRVSALFIDALERRVQQG